MRRHSGILLFIVITLLCLSWGPAPAAAWQSKIDPSLLAVAAEGQTEAIVFLREQADLSEAAELKTKSEKGRFVYERLTEVSTRTQPALTRYLDRIGVEYRTYWVTNMLWVRVDANALVQIAQRADVARIHANPRVHFEQPSEAPSSGANRTSASSSSVEWNIQKVSAPLVWAEGFTGQGVIIGGADTGYNWTHPALKDKYRGWNGSSADHNYNWHDAIHENNPKTAPGNPCGFNSVEPCDDSYHGTHTMGTMVGDDGSGNQIGMAPGAKWIGCRNMEQNWGSPITYSECYQWFIAPTDLNGENPRPDLAPHVINNSWSCPPDEGCTDPEVLRSVVAAVRAAGIVTVHSAGNSGPGCSTITTPGAIYEESFTVGNTTSSDVIAGNSSRGPVIVDKSARLKPDVTAPGSSIRSSLPGGTYGSLSGTSMAGPHVAGLVALLISAYPELAGQVDQLEQLIQQSAAPRSTEESCGGTAGATPNNTYGWGRIDAWSALSENDLRVTKTASATKIEPGGILTYTLSVWPGTIYPTLTNVILTDVLPLQTTFITATNPHLFDGEQVRWDFTSLSQGESRSVELVVQVNEDATGSIENGAYNARSDQTAPGIDRPPVSTSVVPAYQASLSSGYSQSTWPGRTVIYQHILTNTGVHADQYALALSSSLGWAVLTTPSPVILKPDETTVVTLQVNLPADALFDSVEITHLKVTSQSDPGVSLQATNTTRADLLHFFPLLSKP